jgi:NAD-dependent dihydropyrimidine dehydrogenase PreA subunit
MGLVLQPLACRRSYASTMAYVIGRACVDVMDKSCMQECPVDCIYEGAHSLYINPDECPDCGACKLICRMEAIYHEADLPENQQQHLADNATFFNATLPGRAEPLGSPGGASVLGPLGVDTPFVSALPSRGGHGVMQRMASTHSASTSSTSPDIPGVSGDRHGGRARTRNIQCQSCNEKIVISARLPEHYDATEHDNAIVKDSLNELLVDYGWLPTSRSYYCRHHAPQARARLRNHTYRAAVSLTC